MAVTVREVGARVARRALLAHMVGAAVVFFTLAVLAPRRVGIVNEDFPIALVVFVGFLTLAVPVSLGVGDRLSRPVRDWVESDRVPSERERVYALSVPARQALLGFGAWLAAAVVFAVLQVVLRNSALEVARVVIGIVIGGLTSSILAFLLVERTMRPVFALALRHGAIEKPATLGTRHRLMLSWALGSAVPMAAIAFTQVSRTAEERPSRALLLVLVATGLAAGGLSMGIAVRSIADPIASVRAAMDRVRAGDLSVAVEVDDGGEVGLLQAGFNRMVDGLRERRRVEELFGRHVGEEVARLALDGGTALGGEQREASALFVDLIGSTTFAATAEAGVVVDTLNAMFAAVAEVTAAEGGMINKFEGDGALCVFGAPVEAPDHAARALRAARALHRALVDLAASHPGLDAAIGVSSGLVVAGNVGAPNRFEYTVIGDAVNEAARLTEEAKGWPGRVLASQASIDAAGDAAGAWEPADTFLLRGRTRPTKAYRPA